MSLLAMFVPNFLAPSVLVNAVPTLVTSPVAAMKWATIITFLPQFAKVGVLAMRKNAQKFDNNAQRPQLDRERAQNPYGLIASLQAAHDNSLESMIFFFGGALAAHFGAPPEQRELANGIASLFLVARVSFLGLYIIQGKNTALAGLRSMSWLIGMACSIRLMSLAV